MRRCQAQRLRHTYFRPPVTVPPRSIGSRAAGWCAARFMHSQGDRSDPAPRGGALPTSHRPRSAVSGPQRTPQLREKCAQGCIQAIAPQAKVVAAPPCGTPTTATRAYEPAPPTLGWNGNCRIAHARFRKSAHPSIVWPLQSNLVGTQRSTPCSPATSCARRFRGVPNPLLTIPFYQPPMHRASPRRPPRHLNPLATA